MRLLVLLSGGVRNVALVPEGDVLQASLGIAANHTRKAADLLTGYWVPLVWHGGGPFLFFAEELFRFPDFGALQVANLGGDLVQC